MTREENELQALLLIEQTNRQTNEQMKPAIKCAYGENESIRPEVRLPTGEPATFVRLVCDCQSIDECTKLLKHE